MKQRRKEEIARALRDPGRPCALSRGHVYANSRRAADRFYLLCARLAQRARAAADRACHIARRSPLLRYFRAALITTGRARAHRRARHAGARSPGDATLRLE